ncbi:serine hydrolase domain-containing protein [Sinomicrobium sp.]
MYRRCSTDVALQRLYGSASTEYNQQTEMMKILKKIGKGLLYTAGLCVFQTAVYAQSIEERLKEEMEKFEAVGLAVAVVKDNEIIYTNQFGWKDLEAKIPLEKDDVFRIASISKSFSATAIMQLIEQGKVSLDDKVSDLLGIPYSNPKFPNVPITLRMLLTHTSSVTDKQRYGSLDIINPETNEDWAKSYADYAPGTQYKYSNLGYNTVGAIIEAVSGQRFDLYIKEHILDPLGLYGGYLPEKLDAGRFAQLYRYNWKTRKYKKQAAAYKSYAEVLKNYKIGYSAAALSPTGGMKLSATDLAKYMMMHMNYGSLDSVQILKEESSKQMQQPQTPIRKNSDYGFALGIYDGTVIPGAHIVGHTGSAHGLNSSMMFNPEEKYGIVVITNGFIPADPTFRFRVNVILYNHFIKKTPAKAPTAEKVPVNEFSLTLSAQSAKNGVGSFADLKKEEVMNLKEATAHQLETDLVYAFGKSTGSTLMVPASGSLRFYGKANREKVYSAWDHKNLGELLTLESGRESSKLFKDIKTNIDLREAYAQALKEVDKREGYRRSIHGPNTRIYKLQPGDIVFLLINSRDEKILSYISSEEQEVLAVGRVRSIDEGYRGTITIDFKTAVEP